MIARIQVSLSPDEHRRAQTRATELGVSLDEYVRRLIARDLGDRSGAADAQALFDLGDSGASDIASRKQRYLGEAADARPRG